MARTRSKRIRWCRMQFYRTGITLALVAALLGAHAGAEALPQTSSTTSTVGSHSTVSTSSSVQSHSSKNSGSSLHTSRRQPTSVNAGVEEANRKAQEAAEKANPAAMKTTDEERRAQQQADLKAQVDAQLIKRAREAQQGGRTLNHKELKKLEEQTGVQMDKHGQIVRPQENAAQPAEGQEGAPAGEAQAGEPQGFQKPGGRQPIEQAALLEPQKPAPQGRVRSNDPEVEELSAAEQAWLNKRMQQRQQQYSEDEPMTAEDKALARQVLRPEAEKADSRQGYWQKTDAQKRKMLPSDYRSIPIFGEQHSRIGRLLLERGGSRGHPPGLGICAGLRGNGLL